MKPVVTYRKVYVMPVLGDYALLGELKGHPAQARGVMRGEVVRTTPVIRIAKEGGKLTEFETRNSIYRPAEET